MTSDDINLGHFFSTLPNEHWSSLPELLAQLQSDVNTGVYCRISTIYGATTYADYVLAAPLYFQNLPQLQQQYPELFI